MALKYLKIENFKSIKKCKLSLSELNILIGENGTGKTTILDALKYFYDNLTNNNEQNMIFDQNNSFSNCAKVTLVYDCSRFLKISKSNIKNNSSYEGYFKKIISLIYKVDGYLLKVELKQIKNKGIIWNLNYKDRLIIKSLFPLFVVNTREIDILHWDYIWSVISDLNKLSNHERSKIYNELNKVLSDEKKEISKKLKSSEKILQQCNINLGKFKTREFSKILTQLFYSGNIFKKGGKNLSYFSDGTNTINYIELFLDIVNEIAYRKIKDPIILLDEPEISLHPLFIDRLSDILVEKTDDLCIIIATHSPRLIKNIEKVSNDEKMSLFNVKLVENYTSVNYMYQYTIYSPQSKYRVMDDYINSYFSKYILFVEGESELELFSNEYLRILFPKLKSLDVFKGMSENVVLNIMHPKKNKSLIPFLCLVDLDKIIKYDSQKNNFILKKFFWDDSKENFAYYNKKNNAQDVRFLHKRLTRMSKKLKVHYELPFYSCKDYNYYEYLGVIKSYLNNYHVFTFETTIEGTLININNYQYFIDFIKQKNNQSNLEFYDYINTLNNKDKVNIMRMLYGGKSDLLKNYKEIRLNLDPNIEKILEKNCNCKKTNGWISEFIAYYFNRISSTDNIHKFKQIIYKYENKREIIKKFSKDFNELNRLLLKLYDIMDE